MLNERRPMSLTRRWPLGAATTSAVARIAMATTATAQPRPAAASPGPAAGARMPAGDVMQDADRPDKSGVSGRGRRGLPSQRRREETAMRRRARRVTVTSLILGVVTSTAVAVIPAEA